jgi:hypothetical protein
LASGRIATVGMFSFVRNASAATLSVTIRVGGALVFSMSVFPISSACRYSVRVGPYKICCTRFGCTAVLSRNSRGRPHEFVSRYPPNTPDASLSNVRKPSVRAVGFCSA